MASCRETDQRGSEERKVSSRASRAGSEDLRVVQCAAAEHPGQFMEKSRGHPETLAAVAHLTRRKTVSRAATAQHQLRSEAASRDAIQRCTRKEDRIQREAALQSQRICLEGTERSDYRNSD